MIGSEEKDRQILPRWRSIRATIASREVRALREHKLGKAELKLLEHEATLSFNEKLEAWTELNDAFAAEELLSTAIVLNKVDHAAAQDAAQYLITSVDRLPDTLRMAQGALGLVGADDEVILDFETEIRAEISRRKRIISASPRDAYLTTETALLYTVLGQTAKAADLMRRAVALAPEDRYVIRSASRLLVHMGEPDRAIALVDKHMPRVPDPWLMAALLAAAGAADQSPPRWKDARKLVRSKDYSSFDLSELYAAVATLFLGEGSGKQARKLFSLSLENPTENSVAQAEWAHRLDQGVPFPDQALSRVVDTYEATAWSAYQNQEWFTSIEAAESWHNQESFSPRAAIHGSFIAITITKQLARGKKMIKKGLLGSPHDAVLYNNLAVAEAYDGNMKGAADALEAARRFGSETDTNDITFAATDGLIAFRSGKPDEGVSLYTSALERAVQNRQPVYWMRAMAHFARELAMYRFDSATLVRDKLQQAMESWARTGRTVPAELPVILDDVTSMMDRAISQENPAGPKVPDNTTNLLTWDHFDGSA